jgi:dihydrofolate reductase
MPELMVDFITSLDGYGAAEGWPGWWGLEGPEYLAWLGDQPEASYTVLMGANTYRLMSGLATEGEPGTDVLTSLSKVVFSTTLKEPLSWPNTQLVSRDAVEAVREMKEVGTAPMRTIGSLTLCRSLLSACLVDRFRVVVFPVHREHRSGSNLRRLPRCLPRHARQPDIRRPTAARRLQAHSSGRASRHQPRGRVDVVPRHFVHRRARLERPLDSSSENSGCRACANAIRHRPGVAVLG